MQLKVCTCTVSQPVQSRATNEIVQATRIFSHYKNERRNCVHSDATFNARNLKYQIDQLSDQKFGVCLFDVCDDVRKRGWCERCEQCERRAKCGLCRQCARRLHCGWYSMVGAGGVRNVVRMSHVYKGHVPSLSGVSSVRNVHGVDSLMAMWAV